MRSEEPPPSLKSLSILVDNVRVPGIRPMAILCPLLPHLKGVHYIQKVSCLKLPTPFSALISYLLATGPMTTEQNLQHALLQQAIQHSLEGAGSPSGANNKRYAISFPTGLPDSYINGASESVAQDRCERRDDTTWSPSSDDLSTWEFHAPLSNHASRRHSTASSATQACTPAQQLASRYRAGMPLHSILSGSTTLTTATSTSVSASNSHYSTWAIVDERHPQPGTDLKPLYRLSRAEALQRTVSAR